MAHKGEGAADELGFPVLVRFGEGCDLLIGCAEAVDEVVPFGVGNWADAPGGGPVAFLVFAAPGAFGDEVHVVADVVDLGGEAGAVSGDGAGGFLGGDGGEGFEEGGAGVEEVAVDVLED